MDLISSVIILLLSIVSIVYGYFKYSYGYWKSRGIPCDEPSFPHGHLKGVGKTVHMYEIIKRFYDKHKPSGAKLCGAYFFARPIAILFDLDLVKSVFVKDFSNFSERNVYYNEVDDPISASLFSIDGEKWKKLRAKLSPTFSSGRMKFMFPTIVEVGYRFRDCLLEMVQQNEQVDIKDLCARFTTDVIGTCAFGIECNSLRDPNAEFRQYGRKIAKEPRHSPFVQLFLNGFRDFGQKLHVKAIRDDISSFFMNVVRETVEYRERNNVSRSDFMDLLIKLKESPDKDKAITLNEIAAQSFIFFFAAFDTSSSALTFCLYELSLNLEIQAKARQVIQEAYQKHNQQFTYEMMMDMPYIDRILEETLRKHASAPFVTRETKNDYHVSGSDIVIEKGTTLFIPIHAIHNDPEYYPNPEQFDPDRFESEEKAKRHPMTWVPGGDGPRNCIGLRFGLLQFKIGLVILLKNFEFTPGSNMSGPIVIDKKSIVLSPQNDIYLKVKALPI